MVHPLHFQAREKLIELEQEYQTFHTKVLTEQHICVILVSEAAIVNAKFSEYHNIYMDISRNWPPELQDATQFLALENEVNQLSDWMKEFENKVIQIISTTEEMMETATQKYERLMESRDRIFGCNDANIIQDEIEWLNAFAWVDETLWTNAQQLEDEWRDKNALQSISMYARNIAELRNTPEHVLLADLSFMEGRD